MLGFDPQIGERWESVALVVASAFFGRARAHHREEADGLQPAELLGWTYLISLPPLLAVSLALERPTCTRSHRLVAGVGVAAVRRARLRA